MGFLFLFYVSLRGRNGGWSWFWVVKLGFQSRLLWLQSPFSSQHWGHAWIWRCFSDSDLNCVPKAEEQSEDFGTALTSADRMSFPREVGEKISLVDQVAPGLQKCLDWVAAFCTLFMTVSRDFRCLGKRYAFQSKCRAGIQAVFFLVWVWPGF